MVSPLRVEPPGNFPRMIALTVGYPNTGGCTRLRTTKNQLLSVRRHARTKVPDALAERRQCSACTVGRIQADNMDSTARSLAIQLAVKMVDIWSICLIHPRDLSPWRSTGHYNLSIWCPCHYV